jgi:succinate dehydrogenase flavin-adding protein (antitoxin of CptAB toxin-antitoxin module)
MFHPELTDEILTETVETFRAHRKKAKAARKLGISRQTLDNRLLRAAERGLLGTDPVLPGYLIKSIASRAEDGAWVKQVKAPGAPFEVPAGHVVKGYSALVDAENRSVMTWVKTREETSAVDVAEMLKQAFADYPGAATAQPGPVAAQADLMTIFPCNDWHINLLTWGRETGVNWDLKIAERVIGAGIEEAVARSPESELGIVLGGGDLTHADNNEARTARSGNALDVDGRHQKGLEVACRLKVRTIDAALRKCERVIVRILKGNHDEHTAVAIAYFLLAWYRNEPRVTVDVDASLFFWHRFGKVMIGATHGHTVKPNEMAAIMAHRRAEDWGATRFRYVHAFHLHHSAKFLTEGNGVITEVHQAPIPQDAWHYGSGFLSGRSMQTITYHQQFGEVSRVRVAILDAANDNEASAEKQAA